MRKVIEVLHFESADLKHGLTELLPPPLCLRYSPIINAWYLLHILPDASIGSSSNNFIKFRNNSF